MPSGHEDFTTLFAYDHWANARLIAAVEAVSHADVQRPMVRFLAHLARAQEMWLDRVQHRHSSTDPVWPEDTLAEARERLLNVQQGWAMYVQETAAYLFDEPVAYHNSKGTAYSSTPRQVMTHVINHSTHHRAQIMLLLRQSGLAPPPLDYIYYLRTG